MDVQRVNEVLDVEAALARILSELEQLSSKDDAPQLVSSLLKKFDIVTGRHPGDPKMRLRAVEATVREGRIYVRAPG